MSYGILCRCCLVRPPDKGLKTQYSILGKSEVYADMLKECFEIQMPLDTEDNEMGICEICISRLRDARNFKLQVQHCQNEFATKLKEFTVNDESTPKVKEEYLDSVDENDIYFLVSSTEIKEEVSDDLDFNDDDDNQSLAQMLMKRSDKHRSKKRLLLDNGRNGRNDATNFASKILKRMEEVSCKMVTNPRSKLKAAGNNKKGQTEIDEETIKTKRKTKLLREEALVKHRYNIREILLCTNATPIRKYELGYVCCFCTARYPEAAELKQHTITEHDEDTKLDFMKKERMPGFLVKLDITGLKCTLCDKDLLSVEEIIEHLKDDHEKPMFTDIKHHIIPFKFVDSTLRCSFCPKTFEKFKVLQEHMYIHYDNFVCKVCGTGYVNEKMLNSHSLSHKVGNFKCRQCDEEFDTIQKKRYHEKVVHLVSSNKCRYCDEKFMWYSQKCAHMAEVHGIEMKPQECNACNKVFRTKNKLQVHIRKDHLLERNFKCTECDMAFFYKDLLANHMVKHSGVKKFPCKICKKSYSFKRGLREHMRIHNNDRRFKCEICDQAFVQKCSLKGHMRSKHSAVV